MNALLDLAIGFAAICFVGAMSFAAVRVFLGPTAQDRVLAFDALYLNGMLTLLMLGIRSGYPWMGVVRTIGPVPSARRCGPPIDTSTPRGNGGGCRRSK